MNLKTLNIFIFSILQIVLFSAIINCLNVNDACLFKEEGFSLSFVTTPYIHFFIPHNWANDEDNLNHLNIKLFNTNLVLRHPLSSKKESNEINLPLKELNVGWNKIYIRKRRNKVQVVTDNSGSRKGIQNFTLSEDFDSFLDPQSSLVTGLYSLGKCLNARRRIYYNIRAKSSFRLPFILYKKANKFVAFSKTNSFNFNVICSGKRQKICKNGKNSIDSFTIRNECEDGSVSSFSPNIVNDVFVSSKAFDPEDNLNYNHSAFVDLVLENIGNSDFFVEMEVINPSSAPISLLKGTEGSIIFPDTVSESVGKKEPTTTTTTTTEKTTTIVSSIPLEKGCGISSKKDISNRIFGGVTSNSKDWPWMVSFVENSDGASESHVCGGVLITQRLVLTSAGCFYGTTYNDIKVRLGEYDFDTHDEGNHVDFDIEAVKIHEDYNPEVGNEHDIALIKLNRPAGESFPPVCLTPSGMNWDDQFGYATGWGKVNFEGPDSNQLREVLVQIWKKSECDVAHSNQVTDNMICAGGREGKGSCEGDTGGPLVAQILPERRWYVVGIDSWGLGCGFDNSPTVYTKVDSYLDWIKLNYNM